MDKKYLNFFHDDAGPWASELRFTKDPTSVEDPVSLVDPRASQNAPYLAFHGWLEEQLAFLIEHMDTWGMDCQSEARALQKDVQEALTRLQSLVSFSWRKAMIRKGLYGSASVSLSQPTYVATGKSLCHLIL